MSKPSSREMTGEAVMSKVNITRHLIVLLTVSSSYGFLLCLCLLRLSQYLIAVCVFTVFAVFTVFHDLYTGMSYLKICFVHVIFLFYQKSMCGLYKELQGTFKTTDTILLLLQFYVVVI